MERYGNEGTEWNKSAEGLVIIMLLIQQPFFK